MKQKTFLATTALAALIGSGAMAAPVSIDEIGASWQSPTGPAADADAFTIINTPDPVTGAVTIFWGTAPAGGAGQSGYSFAPRSNLPFPANPDTAYSLGTFTHFNQPILDDPGSIETVELSFNFG